MNCTQSPNLIGISNILRLSLEAPNNRSKSPKESKSPKYFLIADIFYNL
jgi:hypothetical protein